MNKIWIAGLVCMALFSACSNEETKPETAMDTARAFIRASLDGNFNRAESFLLKDTLNVQLFSSYKQFYSKLPEEKKESYHNASYEINKYKDVNDSTTLVNYSNSYMNKPIDIKMLRRNNEWVVDFKYTYEENNAP